MLGPRSGLIDRSSRLGGRNWIRCVGAVISDGRTVAFTSRGAPVLGKLGAVGVCSRTLLVHLTFTLLGAPWTAMNFPVDQGTLSMNAEVRFL